MTDQLTIFANRVKEANPLHAQFLDGALAGLSPERAEDAGTYIRFCLDTGSTLDELVAAYNQIVNEVRDEQLFFLRHRKYRNSTFAEVNGAVYANPGYMGKYMRGLALSNFLWPNHVALHEFFLRVLPKTQRGGYLEIGPGHGYYLMSAIRLAGYDRYTAVDVSPTSLAMTGEILRHFVPDAMDKVALREADFLALPESGETYQAIVMGEVLEHVEEPGAFLSKIARLAGPETFIFVTTCSNCPMVDHIYLFDCPDSVERLAREAGLETVERLHVPYVGKSVEDCNRQRLTVNLGYVFRRPA